MGLECIRDLPDEQIRSVLQTAKEELAKDEMILSVLQERINRRRGFIEAVESLLAPKPAPAKIGQ